MGKKGGNRKRGIDKKEKNARMKIGKSLKGQREDGGDRMEKMNGWAEGRQRKGKAE